MRMLPLSVICVMTAFVLTSAVIGALEQWHAAPTDVEAHCHEERLAGVLVAAFATWIAAERKAQGGEPGFEDLPRA